MEWVNDFTFEVMYSVHDFGMVNNWQSTLPHLQVSYTHAIEVVNRVHDLKKSCIGYTILLTYFCQYFSHHFIFYNNYLNHIILEKRNEMLLYLGHL